MTKTKHTRRLTLSRGSSGERQRVVVRRLAGARRYLRTKLKRASTYQSHRE